MDGLLSMDLYQFQWSTIRESYFHGMPSKLSFSSVPYYKRNQLVEIINIKKIYLGLWKISHECIKYQAISMYGASIHLISRHLFLLLLPEERVYGISYLISNTDIRTHTWPLQPFSFSFKQWDGVGLEPIFDLTRLFIIFFTKRKVQ